MNPEPSAVSAMSILERHRDRVLGALMGAMTVAASVAFVYSAHLPLPASALELPGENKEAMARVFPQGWKFFTRDPRMAEPAPMRKVGDEWVPFGKPTDGARFFGANRESRTLWPELSWVLAPMVDSDWRECDGPIGPCLDAAPVRTQAAAVPHPQLCGTIGVVSRKPVPWAWAKRSPAVNMPSKVLRLDIQC
jgi:antimicrobial peptide system SdpA family protein